MSQYISNSKFLQIQKGNFVLHNLTTHMYPLICIIFRLLFKEKPKERNFLYSIALNIYYGRYIVEKHHYNTMKLGSNRSHVLLPYI